MKRRGDNAKKVALHLILMVCYMSKLFVTAGLLHNSFK